RAPQRRPGDHADASGGAPLLNKGVQDFHRQGAGTQYKIVIVAQAETTAHGLFRRLARGDDLLLADHEAAGLPRIDAVAVHFALGRSAQFADGVDHIGDGLFAVPALVVQTGVDHNAPRAPELRLQIADAAVGVGLIGADLVRHGFG